MSDLLRQVIQSVIMHFLEVTFGDTDCRASSDGIPCLCPLHNPRDDSGLNKEPVLRKWMNEWADETSNVVNLLRIKKKSKRIPQNTARWIIGLTAVAVILFWGQEHGG